MTSPHAANLALALDDVFSFVEALVEPVSAYLEHVVEATRADGFRALLLDAVTSLTYPTVLRPLYKARSKQLDMEAFLKLKGLAPGGPHDFGVRPKYLPRGWTAESFVFNSYFVFTAKVQALQATVDWAALNTKRAADASETDVLHAETSRLIAKERLENPAFDDLYRTILFPESITALLGLPVLCSANAKAAQLGVVNLKMKDEVELYHSAHAASGAEASALGADDYTPVICFIIVHAAPASVNAELSYIRDFTSYYMDYNVTTLTGALEVIKEMDYQVRDLEGCMTLPKQLAAKIRGMLGRKSAEAFPVLLFSELFVFMALQVPTE